MTKFEKLVLEGIKLILICVIHNCFANLSSYKDWKEEVDEAMRNEHF